MLQDFLDKQKEYEERLSKLDVVLSDVEDLKKCLSSEVKRRKAAERKAADLEAKLKFANKNRFGDKSHRSKKKSPEEESDRTQDKDDFDGTSSSLPKNSMANKVSDALACPLTTQRNAMLHFGSDEGVEMAATYHSIISTVKMQGRSAWEYLGKFFTKIFNGCRDFLGLRPDKIGLAISQ